MAIRDYLKQRARGKTRARIWRAALPCAVLLAAAAMPATRRDPALCAVLAAAALSLGLRGRAGRRAPDIGDAAFDQAADGIVAVDAHGRIERMNPAASALTGWTPDAARGAPAGQVLRIVDAAGAPLPIRAGADADGRLQRRGGGTAPVGVAQRPTGRRGGLLVTLRDLSQQRRMERELRRLAHRDPDTGLLNHDAFIERLAAATAGDARPCALLVLSVCKFDRIFASFGVRHGQALAGAVARRLRALLPGGDRVAQVSAGTFAALLPGVQSGSDAEALARRLLSDLSAPYRVGGADVYALPVIGVSLFPEDACGAEKLLGNAMAAAYQARLKGTHVARWSAEANARILADLRMESALRQALDAGQFVLHYQPRVNLSDGVVRGFEALLRWQHPERGLVPPSDFISLLEDTGLILPVGDWVIRESCLQFNRCRDAGLHVGVSVNLSAVQLRDEDFVDRVRRILRETEMDPARLEFELTESLLIDGSAAVIETLEAFRRMGIRISIDDFGTGWSSLSYLSRFPVDTLKIDQSFVRQVVESPDNGAIVCAIISLANSLRLHVLAEGVETEDQLKFLKEHGCDEIQGFWLSKPLPAPLLINWIKGHSRPVRAALVPASGS